MRMKLLYILFISLIISSCGPERGPLRYKFVERGITEVAPSNPLLLQSTLEELLIPKCQMCHPWIGDEDQLFERIVPGKPLESSLYYRIEDGTMPPFGGGLNNEELTRVYESIEALRPSRNDQD